jgi:ABC-2 type transport system permease protein
MTRWKYVWFIAQKDLKIFSRDRSALIFFVLFPLSFMTLFSFMGQGAEDPRLELHLVTREGPGSLSYQIIDSMVTVEGADLEPGSPIIIRDKDYEEALKKVENEQLDGFLAFPKDFTAGVYQGQTVELEVVTDPSNINTRAALQGLASGISSEIGSHSVIISSTIELMISNGLLSPDDAGEIQKIAAQLLTNQGITSNTQSGITIEVEKTGELEAENAINWSLTGYLVMFVFFGAAMAAESIVKERQNHTLERLLTGSVRREEILGGMFLGTAIKGIIQIILFWIFGILVFNADLGLAPAAVIVLSILMVIMSSAFAIMLATLVKTQRSAGSVGTLTSLVLAPLGGCWWPLFILPKWMQGLAKVTPHGWANTGFNKLMLFGAEFGDVVPEMLVLAAFTIVFGTIAIWRFRTDAT